MPDTAAQQLEAPAEPSLRRPRWADAMTRLRPTHVVFWASLAVIAGSALIRNRTVFTTAQYPLGDQSVNTLLVNRAIRFDQYVGNYSRIGFHHPGPALFYMLGWGQWLFRNVLHVVPDPYNGQLVASYLFGAALVALALVSVYRLTGSRGATLIAFGILFLFAAQHALMGDVWFPLLYMAPFLLFVIAGAGVTAGRTSELPSYVLAACLLVHGHISFVMFVAVTSIVAAGGWLLAHRGQRRGELDAHRRAVRGSAAVLALFALPLVVNTVVHYPGEWPKYFHYSLHPQLTPRTAGEIVHFTSQFWRLGAPIALTAVALVLGVVLTVRERNHDRRRVFLAFYGVAALETLLTYVYVARGVDALDRTNSYIALFARGIPATVVMAAAVQAWLAIADRSAGPRRRPVAVAVPVVVALVLSVVAATSPRMIARRQADIHLPQLVASVKHDPARHGRSVEYVLDVHDVWTSAGGVVVESGWQHLPWCIRRDPRFRWALLYGGFHLCQPGGPPRWVVHLTLNQASPSGGRVLYRTYYGTTLVTAYARDDGT